MLSPRTVACLYNANAKSVCQDDWLNCLDMYASLKISQNNIEMMSLCGNYLMKQLLTTNKMIINYFDNW